MHKLKSAQENKAKIKQQLIKTTVQIPARPRNIQPPPCPQEMVEQIRKCCTQHLRKRTLIHIYTWSGFEVANTTPWPSPELHHAPW